MVLLVGEITVIIGTNEKCSGVIRVGGAYTKVSLAFVNDPRVGDVVLVEAGVAIGKVEREQMKEDGHVSGHTR